MYTKGIPKGRKLQNKMVFYKLHQSSIQTGTPWMHQKEIRDKRLLLNFRKFISIPSKALLLGCWYEENILREVNVIRLTKRKHNKEGRQTRSKEVIWAKGCHQV